MHDEVAMTCVCISMQQTCLDDGVLRIHSVKRQQLPCIYLDHHGKHSPHYHVAIKREQQASTDLWNCSSAGAVTQESSLHQGCGTLLCPVLLLPSSVAEYQDGLHLLLLEISTPGGACSPADPDIEAAAETAGEADSNVSVGSRHASPD